MIKKKIKDLDKFDFEHKTDIIYFRNKIDESEGRLVIITNYNKYVKRNIKKRRNSSNESKR